MVSVILFIISLGSILLTTISIFALSLLLKPIIFLLTDTSQISDEEARQYIKDRE